MILQDYVEQTILSTFSALRLFNDKEINWHTHIPQKISFDIYVMPFEGGIVVVDKSTPGASNIKFEISTSYFPLPQYKPK